MNNAVIAPITVYPHPNADKIQLGNVMGYQVVIGLEVKTGDLGIFFPEGLQLSRDYCKANQLLREDGGYFEANRRVRCQKFRGERSEGFWSPVDSLAFLGKHKLVEGDRLTELNGVELCCKYITPATRMSREGKKKSNRGETTMFHKHMETDQLRMNYHRLDGLLDDPVIITQKLHGTSQRVGRVLEEKKPGWFRRNILPGFPKWLQNKFPNEREWVYLIGSRNVIVEPDTVDYYGEGFRQKAANKFLGRLEKGETVYYEVVGFEALDKPIMGTVNNKEVKGLADKITYKYGCVNGQMEVYVYRITHTNEDGYTIDLPWTAVKKRCQELLVKSVPHLYTIPGATATSHGIKAFIEEYFQKNELADPLDPSHPLEGVVVRIDRPFKPEIYKHKTFTFGLLEGYLKSQDTYVDTEESA
jgi:hypothetical protein